MPVRNYKPNTPGQRKRSVLVNTEITKATPEKSLVVSLKKNGGRNGEQMEKTTADYMGMLATAMNALALQDAI